MKLTKLVIAAFLCLAVSAVHAQREETVLGSRGLGLSGFWANWNHQITPFNDKNNYVSGWQFNLEFGKSLVLGFGNYYLQDEFTWDQISDKEFDLRFSAFKVGYNILSHRAVHPNVNVDFGPGRLWLGADEDRVFVVQPSVGLEVNIFRWLRLGVDGGYRFLTDSSIAGLDDNKLSGAFGQASIKFGYSWGGGRSKKSQDRNKNRYED